MRDAQRQSIKFEAVVTVPMATNGEQIELLKKKLPIWDDGVETDPIVAGGCRQRCGGLA